jgi:hypothetical protein
LCHALFLRLYFRLRVEQFRLRVEHSRPCRRDEIDLCSFYEFGVEK